MLPRSLRLDTKEIQPLAYKGDKEISKGLHIRYSPFSEHRFAISISTRVDKRATVRNRIKRKIRSRVQQLVKEDKIPKGKYLIIVKSPRLADNDYLCMMAGRGDGKSKK
jgi:ribonuclease P protein component